MPSSKIQTGLRLEEELYEKIKVIAERKKRSRNKMMEYVLEKYVEDYEKQNGAITPFTEES